MNTQELKLQLIQWILEIKSRETLEMLLLWKERQRQEKAARFLSGFGAWQSDENDEDLMDDIYGSRYFEDREIDL